MTAPTDEQMRIAIAEACGVQPKRMWRVWYDAERQHAAICIPTKNQAIERAAQEEAIAVMLGYPLTISQPEEYDEWDDAPDYLNSLDAMHSAEITLTKEQRRLHWNAVVDVVRSGGEASIFDVIHATARQRAEAFLRVVRPDMFL